MIVTAEGRTNMPLPMAHSKYCSPLMLPSFFPEPSPNSTPTQAPGANIVSPTKRTIASRPSARRTVCPTARSDIVSVCYRGVGGLLRYDHFKMLGLVCRGSSVPPGGVGVLLSLSRVY